MEKLIDRKVLHGTYADPRQPSSTPGDNEDDTKENEEDLPEEELWDDEDELEEEELEDDELEEDDVEGVPEDEDEEEGE